MDFSAYAGLFDPAAIVATLLASLFAGMAGGGVAVVLAAALGR
jgi:hypothetical protein